MTTNLRVSEPVLENGEAVLFLDIFGRMLRLGYRYNDIHMANAAAAATRIQFLFMGHARATWDPNESPFK